MVRIIIKAKAVVLFFREQLFEFIFELKEGFGLAIVGSKSLHNFHFGVF
jgi:hypothetical protein